MERERRPGERESFHEGTRRDGDHFAKKIGLERHFVGAGATAPPVMPLKKGPLSMRGALKRIRRRPTLPPRCQGSTIGAGELNFRVRDGNGCCLFAIATEKRCYDEPITDNLYAILPANVQRSCELFCGQAARPISTSKLNALPHLHTWPINLVVFKGPLVLRVSPEKGYLILG